MRMATHSGLSEWFVVRVETARIVIGIIGDEPAILVVETQNSFGLFQIVGTKDWVVGASITKHPPVTPPMFSPKLSAVVRNGPASPPKLIVVIDSAMSNV